jgi:subtilisin family serine protease
MARKAATKSKKRTVRQKKSGSKISGVQASKAIPIHVLGAENAPETIGSKGTNTVLYVHGINNKPIASILKCQWDMNLFRARLGDRSRMAYWVNRNYYPTPLNETCADGDTVNIDDDEISTQTVMALARGESGSESRALNYEIEALARNHKEKVFLHNLADKMVSRVVHQESKAAVQSAGVRAKILPLPAFMRRFITEKITRAFMRDVHDFLFVEERRRAMEQSLIERIEAGGGPFVIVAHSQGSMIAYNVLRRLSPSQCKVPLLVTIGSPLGISEVQDVLRQFAGKPSGKLPFPPCVDRWINVAAYFDPVAADPSLAEEFESKGGRTIEDALIQNPDSPRHPHSATGYLRTEEVRSAVREVTGTSFEQMISRFALAKDLVSDMEDGQHSQLHSALIQLSDDRAKRFDSTGELDGLRLQVTEKIREVVIASGRNFDEAEVDPLRHFISARLTRLELETLRSYFDDLKIAGIWRNAKKRALITDSTHTIQAKPANLGYGADGNNVCWAVLDTGIRGDHPHFKKHGNILRQWDCTKRGAAQELKPGTKAFGELDKDGHGTHVAGIIAGEYEVGSDIYTGMAPRAGLFGFKVLDDNGEGEDAWIVKALDKIAEINEKAGSLRIHGVNLSLGGSFDPEVFGCGHTPLCQELRRLWRQGVLVCLAAGNEGYAVLMGEDGEIPTNLDLSIGDPANLEEAIAVGSVHKLNPHTYGISYFSSRGPTADGRRKPDVVAPGERIISARHDWRKIVQANKRVEKDLYVDMSGTSMAAPHVSGLLASFLSLRREFIGYPDRVKEILLGGCIDLKRDPYMQGAGLPNLIKMLALN